MTERRPPSPDTTLAWTQSTFLEGVEVIGEEGGQGALNLAKTATATLSYPRVEARAEQLHETLAAYNLDASALRRLVALGTDIQDMLRSNTASPEIAALLTALSHLLRPLPGEHISGPAEMAAVLMVEMGHLDQEQMRVVCLDAKNRIQKIHLAYQGTVNSIQIRVGELFKEPIRLNSASIILAHNHPSGEPQPSAEDAIMTRQVVAAGQLLGIECLDHLIIGQGRWISLKDRNIGF
jgi:hypothetical protein